MGGRREKQHLQGCDKTIAWPSTLIKCTPPCAETKHSVPTNQQHTDGTDWVGLRQGNKHLLNVNSGRHWPRHLPSNSIWSFTMTHLIEETQQSVSCLGTSWSQPHALSWWAEMMASADGHDGTLLHTCSRRCVNMLASLPPTSAPRTIYAFAAEVPESHDVLDVCSWQQSSKWCGYSSG